MDVSVERRLRVTAKALEQYGPSSANSVPASGTTLPAPLLTARFLAPLSDLMRELSLDPAQCLQEAGLEPATFTDEGRSISFPELERLFAVCERRAGADHVGLLFGQRLGLRDLGLSGNAALSSATAGDAIRALVDHCNLHDTPAIAQLGVHGDRASFSWRLDEHCLVDARHFDYAGLAVSRNLLRDLLGAGWQPRAVRFASRHPVQSEAFVAYFGAPVEFDAERSEIEFDARVLAQPLPALEPAAQTAIAAELQQARLDLLADLPTTLRRVLRKRLLLGDFSMDDVAAQLSMHRRTLDRRLQRSDTTYGELLETVRDDIARQLLRDTRFSIQRIAESVRFSSAANFATAFRRRTGMTPTEYRRAR